MSHNARIYDTDTVIEISRKIYFDFDVMASCSITGFITKDLKLVPKGEIVLQEILKLYELENVSAAGKRTYKYRKDSIGGPIAHKIFTYEKRIVDSEVRYTIWRYQ